MDRRRPGLGAGVHVRRAGRRRAGAKRPGIRSTSSRRCGRTTAPPSARRSSTSWRWCASGASGTRRCTSTTTPRTRRPRCCGWPGATGWARTRSTTCCATGCSSTCIPWCARAFGSAPRTTASSRWSRCTWVRSCATARSPRRPTPSPCTPSTASCAPRAATTKPPTCSRRSRTTTATTAGPPASCATGCWAAPSNRVSRRSGRSRCATAVRSRWTTTWPARWPASPATTSTSGHPSSGPSR